MTTDRLKQIKGMVRYPSDPSISEYRRAISDLLKHLKPLEIEVQDYRRMFTILENEMLAPLKEAKTYIREKQ